MRTFCRAGRQAAPASFLIFLLVLAAGALPASAQVYDIEDLGTLGGVRYDGRGRQHRWNSRRLLLYSR